MRRLFWIFIGLCSTGIIIAGFYLMPYTEEPSTTRTIIGGVLIGVGILGGFYAGSYFISPYGELHLLKKIFGRRVVRFDMKREAPGDLDAYDKKSDEK